MTKKWQEATYICHRVKEVKNAKNKDMPIKGN